ncbi:calmodulin-like protein 7 [Rosa sericea]
MPTILIRIFLIYNLLNAFLLSLVPKKLRPLLPSCWFPDINHNEAKAKTRTKTRTSVADKNKGQAQDQDQLRITRMEPTELKRVFQMFDQNGDGRISRKELSDSLENLGIFIPDKELLNMIQKIDVDGDGCVDIDEFGELYQSIMDERNEEEDMKEAFNVFDQNGDGFIAVDELRSVLSSLGLKQGKSIEDCKRMIMKVDVDGDGRVNYKEFKQMMKGGGFSALT